MLRAPVYEEDRTQQAQCPLRLIVVSRQAPTKYALVSLTSRSAGDLRWLPSQISLSVRDEQISRLIN